MNRSCISKKIDNSDLNCCYNMWQLDISGALSLSKINSVFPAIYNDVTSQSLLYMNIVSYVLQLICYHDSSMHLSVHINVELWWCGVAWRLVFLFSLLKLQCVSDFCSACRYYILYQIPMSHKIGQLFKCGGK